MTYPVSDSCTSWPMMANCHSRRRRGKAGHRQSSEQRRGQVEVMRRPAHVVPDMCEREQPCTADGYSRQVGRYG